MEQEKDSYYFDSYAHFGIHREMLSDKVRTISYQKAILDNPAMFKDKVILDVGCGTGILSLFAAKCGAKKVYAVEKSTIGNYAKKIIEKNGYSNQIILLQTTIEEASIPEKVDVIISEWMGYCLLYESMLNSVIFARDKYLKEGGTMYPTRASMFITGIEDKIFYHRKFLYWEDFCGFNLEPVKQWAVHEPVIEVCPEKQIVTDDSKLIEFDLNKVSENDLSIDATFSLTSLESTSLYGFVVWFDVLFEGKEETIMLSTSPFEEPTHWSQTIFYLERPVKLTTDTIIEGRFMMKPNEKNFRDQDVTIKYNVDGYDFIQEYKIR
ncbi:protein arginine N-methyltransferase 1 [Histomonas meleagridis]|uniref:protein arginine N-methyltransferase 1 n=1 Tax=Histomonas meleagridis TaxID=135588 RepID=UPI00355A5862|nr:protein arginine N-methyltransferase 1 [Histomonas meleagridis]KAH0807103.1 protein arginine N-methyltransferase 1 [Histomonas meleagridis]